MKILSLVLIVGGIALIASGLYNAFVPQEVLDIEIIELTATEGFDNQSLAMVCLGVIAFVAGAFLTKKR